MTSTFQYQLIYPLILHRSILAHGGECGKPMFFRKALGPRLQQIDPEYVIPEEEVLNLCISLLLDHPFLYLTNPANSVSSNRMVQNL